MMGAGGMGWMMLLQWVGGVVLLVIIVVAAVLVARGRSAAVSGERRAAARELLDQRLARSEIDEDEYLRRLSALESRPPESRRS